MARPVASGPLLVEQAQFAASFNRESVDRPAFFPVESRNLPHRIEKTAAGMDCEKARIDGGGGELPARNGPILCVEPVAVNATTSLGARVSANVKIVFHGG